MPEHRMAARLEASFGRLSFVDWSRLSFRERIVDQLAEVILHADDILEMLASDAHATDLRWLVEPNIRAVNDDVHTLMKSLCD